MIMEQMKKKKKSRQVLSWSYKTFFIFEVPVYKGLEITGKRIK